MLYCPKCRSEYVDGIENCSDCGEKLAAELPPEEKEEYFVPEWVKILNVGSEFQAEMVAEVIRDSNIPVRYTSQTNQVLPSMDLMGFGVDIFVPVEFKEQAAEIINVTFPLGLDSSLADQGQEEISYNDEEMLSEETTKDNNPNLESKIIKDGERLNSNRSLIYALIILILIFVFFVGINKGLWF